MSRKLFYILRMYNKNVYSFLCKSYYYPMCLYRDYFVNGILYSVEILVSGNPKN